jgi:Protein of unknown function (DUF2878)
VSARTVYLLNYGAYQLGWLVAILGAAAGVGTAGASLAFALTAGHVVLARDRRGEAVLVLAALACGVVVESWQMASGTYRVLADAAPGAWPPLWLLALWAQFATTFRFSLRRIMTNPRAALLFGALGGPIAFLAGERLGAVVLQVPLGPGLARLVAAWALALAALAWGARRLAAPAAGYRSIARG